MSNQRKNLENIIADYAFSKMQNNGLLLLPLPTGAGKSYTVFKFIHDTLVEGKHPEKIIFITSLKKNLQPEELKEQFSADEKALFDQKVLYLKSNLDCVLENLIDLEKKHQIPERIQNLDEYQSLSKAVKFCNDMANNPTFGIQDIVQTKKDEIRNTYEKYFREKVKQLLSADFKKNLSSKAGFKQKLDFVKNLKNKWDWLLDLYPQVLTKERQVYLMSMDKFLLRNDPILEDSYFIYKELAPNAIVFIDEFDATKDTILKRLIENAVKSKIDYVAAYKLIHDRLNEGNFPAEMTTASQRQLKSESSGYGLRKLESVIPGWKKRADEIYDRFEMKYALKQIESEVDSAFLFQDIHSMVISKDGASAAIKITPCHDRRVDEISYSEKIENEHEIDFKYMIKDVRGFLKFFCGGVQILATNLVELRQENGKDFTFEEAVNSILDLFFLGDISNSMKHYFAEEILLYHTNKEESKKKEFDGSFFENGFTYFAIEDDNGHSLRSAVRMTSLESTPEKILLEICKNARVFGISATANYDTVIGNYAIQDYIIPKLKEQYFELAPDESEVLERHFKKSICHYDRVKMNVIPVGDEDVYSQDSWQKIFPNDDDDCEEIYNLISQRCSADDKEYHKKRYLRIATVFKNFMDNEEIQSMLCLLTRFPKDLDAELDTKILEDVFNRIAQNRFSFKDNVCILRSGSDYDAQKDGLLTALSHGKKLLVISTYQTIGAGQNLLYDIPEMLNAEGKLVQVNDFKRSLKKDFDSIYLDKPTNLFVQLSDGCDEKTFVKFIAQVEYLKGVGEIAGCESRQRIKEAFLRKFFGGRMRSMRQRDLKSFSSFATKSIVQAMGRICRRNVKRPNIYIFYDTSITEILDKKACEKNLLNPEFEALLQNVQMNREKDVSLQKWEQAAINKSDEALTRIIKYVSDGRNGWKENAIEEWQQIRRFVLQYPTLSELEFNTCDDLFQPFYARLPEKNDALWFSREGDYDAISLSFSPKNAYECVSSESARLEKILQIPQVKKMFETEHFAMTFEKNDYILCPPVFTNIYKGALGEYAGKCILASLGVELEEIQEPEFFELFDYKIKGSNVYVDFKHWNQYSKFLPQKSSSIYAHIFEKLKKSGGCKALVINMFAEEMNLKQMRRTQNENLELIEVPYLYGENSFKMNEQILEILRG